MPRASGTSLTVGTAQCSLAVAPGKGGLESPLPAGLASPQLPCIPLCQPRGSITLPKRDRDASNEPLSMRSQPPAHSRKQEELLYTQQTSPSASCLQHPAPGRDARKMFLGLRPPVASPPCAVRNPAEMNPLLFCFLCLTPAPCPLSLS